MTDETSVPTAERTLHLIELLLDKRDGLTPQELLLHLDISRSSLFMLLRTLKTLGYIEQSEKRGKYRLGPRLESWRSSEATPATQDLLSAFYQEAARQANQETLALAVESSGEVLILAQVEGSQRVRSVFTPGQVYADLTAVVEVLNLVPNEQVMSNGYCLISGENSFELALPICRDGRHPEAALLLSAPNFRWTEANFISTVLEDMRVMAARLSYHLGAVTYTPYRNYPELLRQPTTQLDEPEARAFLKGPWTARLACVRPDGHPHVIPVWQEWDGERFYVIAWKGSQWADYILQNPNVSLTVDEPWPPLRRIVVRGHAEPVEMKGTAFDLDRLIQRMSERYLGYKAAGLAEQVQSAFCILPDFMSGRQGMPGPLSSA